MSPVGAETPEPARPDSGRCVPVLCGPIPSAASISLSLIPASWASFVVRSSSTTSASSFVRSDSQTFSRPLQPDPASSASPWDLLPVAYKLPTHAAPVPSRRNNRRAPLTKTASSTVRISSIFTCSLASSASSFRNAAARGLSFSEGPVVFLEVTVPDLAVVGLPSGHAREGDLVLPHGGRLLQLGIQ